MNKLIFTMLILSFAQTSFAGFVSGEIYPGVRISFTSRPHGMATKRALNGVEDEDNYNTLVAPTLLLWQSGSKMNYVGLSASKENAQDLCQLVYGTELIAVDKIKGVRGLSLDSAGSWKDFDRKLKSNKDESLSGIFDFINVCDDTDLCEKDIIKAVHCGY